MTARYFWTLQAIDEHVAQALATAKDAARIIRSLDGYERELEVANAHVTALEKDLRALRIGVDPRNGTWRNGADSLVRTVKAIGPKYRDVAERAWRSFPG
jgi:hypothetical protein